MSERSSGVVAKVQVARLSEARAARSRGEKEPRPEVYRVSVIADAVGIHATTVLRGLRGIPFTSTEIVNGRPAAAYALADLPPGIVAKLSERARALDLDLAGVLRNAATRKPWQPSIPYARVNSAAQAKARRLREALRWVLDHHDRLPFNEVRERGLADYERAFGRKITARHWNSLFERTTVRAGALEDYDRLDLYLDERAAPALPAPKADFDPAPLKAAADLIADISAPTPKERARFWKVVINFFQALCRSGADERQVKRWVLAETFARVPGLAKTPAALGEAFRVKLKRIERGESVHDARKGRSGRKALIEVDLELLLARAQGNRGRIASSWKELWDEGQLHPTAYEFGNRENPPVRIRQAARAEYKVIDDQVIGPKHGKLHGAKLVRTWDGIPSGTEAQSDDCTPNAYMWVERPEGRYEFEGMRFDVLRGQFLPWIDTRTSYIYCFSLLASESYGSLDIVRGLIALHDRWGLPRRLYLERGIWERSSIISGRKDEFDMESRISGLSDLGIELAHAHDPSAKIVERVFGELQNYMDRLPGFAGRNEREELPESTKTALDAVRAGRCHPGKHLLSYDQMVKEFEKACDRFNDTPSGPRSRLKGLSPRQAFVQFLDKESPPVQFPRAFRYLLATNRRRERIGPQGITIRIGSNAYVYRSEEMGARKGQTVMAYFDMEDPEWIAYTDLEGGNPEYAPRATLVPPIGADRETIRSATREAAAFDRPARERISALKRTYPEEFPQAREIITDRKSVEFAERLESGKANIKKANNEAERRRRKDADLRRKAGIPAIFDPRRADGQRTSAKDLAAFLSAADNTESEDA